MSDTSIRVIRYLSGTRLQPFDIPAREAPLFGTPLARVQEREIARWSGGAAELVEAASEGEALALAAREGRALVLPDDLYVNAELLAAFMTGSSAGRAGVTRAALPLDSRMVADFVAPLNALPVAPVGGRPHALLPLLWFEGPACAVEPAPVGVAIDEEHHFWMDLPPPPETRREPEGRTAFLGRPIAPYADFAPLRVSASLCAALPLRHWVHLLTANVVLGLYGESLRFARGAPLHLLPEPVVPPRSLRDLVIVEEGAYVDPAAVVVGPTWIRSGAIVEAGACVLACVIGRDAHIGQGCQLRLTVVGDRAVFPPPVSCANFSVVLDDALVNSPLRFSVAGRQSFLGAGVMITDRVFRDGPASTEVTYGGSAVRVRQGEDFEPSGYWILGCAIGDRARVASGTLVYPGRVIAADSVVLAGGDPHASAPLAVVR